jgi:hypothetical protein
MVSIEWVYGRAGGDHVPPQLPGDVIGVDHHRRDQRGHEHPLVQRAPDRPQHEQRGQDVGGLVKGRGGELGVAGQGVAEVADREHEHRQTERGRRERCRPAKRGEGAQRRAPSAGLVGHLGLPQ